MSWMISSALADSLVFEGLLIFLIGRRTYRLVKGTSYSESRILLTIALYALLFGITLAETYFLFPLYLLGVYALIVVVGLFVFLGHSEKAVVFERTSNGQWTYRLPWLVGGLYLGLWIARLGLEVVFFPQVLELQPVTSVPSQSALIALATVDGLFALSTGFMFGRNLGVMRAYGKLRVSPEPPATPGSDSSPPLH